LTCFSTKNQAIFAPTGIEPANRKHVNQK